MIFRAENFWSGSYVTITIIQDFPVKLLLQRFIEFGSYLEPWISFWIIYLFFPHFTYLIPYYLYHKVGKTSIYRLKEYFSCGIYLCFVHLLKYEIIILERYPMTKTELSIRRNQIFSLVKLSGLSLVLVRVYFLDDKGLSLICHWYCKMINLEI